MNVLLVSIDSLRLDYVSQTNPRIKTPAFDALTRDFCFYQGLFSASTATRPVHTSLFTGLYPFEHGVLGQTSKAMRSDIPTLFELLQKNGVTISAFSEAPEIFTGLSYADFIQRYALGAISQALTARAREQRFVFLHYWGAHTPYGAADAKALGETAQLLRSGQQHVVQHRYARAVEQVFDSQLAPLLASLDRRNWCVFIFSDHGESWTAEEPYHGCTLQNSVLRVPFYYHIPGTGNPLPARPVLSLIDLFPTLLHLFETESEYRGWGIDMRWNDAPQYRFAQIHPDPKPLDLPSATDEHLLIGAEVPGNQWALFDDQVKFTYDEKKASGRLENTWSEEWLQEHGEITEQLCREYEQMVQQSPYAQSAIESTTPQQDELLDQRLRDLGYLE